MSVHVTPDVAPDVATGVATGVATDGAAPVTAGVAADTAADTGSAAGSDVRPGTAPTASYVLPLRRHPDADPAELDELTDYVCRLARRLEVVVVDGSDELLPASHPWRREPRITYLAPHWRLPNGKVSGVLTGLLHASHERVVVADDDVRWDHGPLAETLQRLDHADLVRPQNVFWPQPWHARWDTGRTLLNRAVGHDYPGTFALRRSTVLRAGGYCGGVLFENLQLLRTVEAAGGRVVAADDVLVVRLPPSTGRFLEQRVRQAYDSTAQPVRLAAELALLPLAGWLWRRRGLRGVTGLAAALVLVAEAGRRRHGGVRTVGPWAAVWAPGWAAERAVCSWLAVFARVLRGGVAYAGGRLDTAATPPAQTLPGQCRRQPCPCAEARSALLAQCSEEAA